MTDSPYSADSGTESVTACCDGATYPFVNDAAMDSVREQFTTADSMLKNVGYDGKQIKHELSLMFAELAMWRRSAPVIAAAKAWWEVLPIGDDWLANQKSLALIAAVDGLQ